MSPDELAARMRDASGLVQDCNRQRSLCRASPGQSSAASWWSLRARAARGGYNRARARYHGLNRSWVLGAAHHIVDGLEQGDVLQLSRYAAGVQLRRDGGLFAPTRRMLRNHHFGGIRVAVRHQCARRGIHLHEGSEAYTTKQCCFCGLVLSKEQMPLGEKVFTCPEPECGFSGHRDGKAALAALCNVLKHLHAEKFLAELKVPVAAGAHR